MNKLAAVTLCALSLAACADQRLTPPPGVAPDWPSQTPPRPSYAPLPWTDNYQAVTPVQTMPAVPPGQNVPYAVPAGAAPIAPAPTTVTWKPPAAPAGNPDEPPPAAAAPRETVAAAAVTADMACQSVAPFVLEGKTVKRMCKRTDGQWVAVVE
ncbi:exported hypothetical protein [Magnetospirillum sp. LM-5]|uniref:hypothetical protein n=1 Tax=Magnetospirillum sp. LM-5 TaxID=2681466 RepID=UPI0013828F5F|nr:hypothetical protein [Magnetospirillum sp. LM-5]CAA7623818.1 exported hypothetical protein [Magnetospirillum sp. LM-5]